MLGGPGEVAEGVEAGGAQCPPLRGVKWRLLRREEVHRGLGARSEQLRQGLARLVRDEVVRQPETPTNEQISRELS